MTLHSYWTSKCAECPLKTQCTTGKERRYPRILDAVTIVRPETVVRSVQCLD